MVPGLKSGRGVLDHNALTSIVSFNLPFFPTTRTLYLSIPSLLLVINLQSSCFISYGERRKGPSKFTGIRVWSLMTGGVALWTFSYGKQCSPLHVINDQSLKCPGTRPLKCTNWVSGRWGGGDEW